MKINIYGLMVPVVSSFLWAKRRKSSHGWRIRGFVIGLSVLISLRFFSVVEAQRGPEYRSGVVVVQFDSTTQIVGKSNRTGPEGFDHLASRYEVSKIERVYPFLDHVTPTSKTRRNLLALRRTYYVHYNAGSDPVMVAGSLSGAQGVVYAEPVSVNRIHAARRMQLVDPNDPEYSKQSELRLLRLPEIWDEVKSESGSPKVVIAVVDVGGEWRHEDLRANAWTNQDEIPDNGIDDDNNGFIDDVHGVNFSSGEDSDNDPTARPGFFGSPWHGTAVAGAVGAVNDNNIGIAGSSWNALLMHINAAHASGLGISYGYEGILYAAMNGASIINTSWGSIEPENTHVQFLAQSLDLATDMGSLIIASVGNADINKDLFRIYPARHPRVLSVGATGKSTVRRASFSNYGKLVDVFAPGDSVLTTGLDNKYMQASGTSFAAPLVSGIAALVKTKFPDITPDELREKVRLSAENIDSENPDFHGQLGRGFVNGLVAIQEANVPAIRLKEWSWEDDDENNAIDSGDIVRVKALFVNHLADASQLTIGLVSRESYPFIELPKERVEIGFLAGGDSKEVTFEFRVTADAPLNQHVRFYAHVRTEQMEDIADMISFRVNRSLEVVYQSLNTLYTGTGGDQWHDNSNWNFTSIPTEEELSQWYGISMSEGWLRGLDLAYNNLTETIPPELRGLSELQVLDLSGNHLSGRVPGMIGHLPELRMLHLGDNSLSGSIPSSLGNLQKLKWLELFENSLSGVIPSSLGNLATLKVLNLEENSLSGSIPPELGDLPRLEWLGLELNSLSGVIPPEFGNLSRLSVLDLSDNSLSGSIPSSLGNLSGLSVLDLSDNSLSGSIPSSLGNLSGLSVLGLGQNTLSGSIPPEFGNLSGLTILKLEQNTLSGPIPPEIGNLPELKSLVLRENSLSGAIPSMLGDLSKLDFLDLAHNDLSGPIPPELGNLSNLGKLDLSGNSLTGSLPKKITQLENLRMFWFQGQNLCAPNEIEFQKWLKSISDVMGRTCGVLGFVESIEDQRHPRDQPIPPLVLPRAVDGTDPVQYTLTPIVPAGLNFDSSTRTLSGTPTMITPHDTKYVYKATDAIGNSDSLQFTISIYSPVSTQDESLPKTFVVRGNYPNPFQKSTKLTFDLPWPARVQVEVMDALGRRVLYIPERNMSPGWAKSVELNGEALSAGLYLYRLIANSPTERSIQTGSIVRIR